MYSKLVAGALGYWVASVSSGPGAETQPAKRSVHAKHRVMHQMEMGFFPAKAPLL
jgi:hypothetical protein